LIFSNEAIVLVFNSAYLGHVNLLYKHTLCILFCFLLFGQAKYASAQNAGGNAVLEISEIVLPQGERLKHQKNLYYEVYSSHTNLPTPAYWYKMVFIKDCSLKFSLFPLYEQDTYDIHCFKISPEAEVCKAIAQNKLVSVNAQRMYKDYNDDEVKVKADAGFLEFKEINLKAGDVLYIEVFSTRGKDCGHIFECQTNSAFFVIKHINRQCPPAESYANDNSIPTKQYQTVESEKEAIEYLNKTFCKIKENDLTVMTIKMNDVKPVFTSGLDFVAYSKNINEIAQKLPPEEVVKPVKTTTTPTPPPALVQKPKVDTPTVTVIKPEPIVVNKPPAPIVPKEPIKPTKSTADLETTETPSNTNETVAFSRLELDKSLFTLLTQDLKGQLDYNNNLIKEYNSKLKKSKNTKEKESLTSSIKELKEQNTDLQNKTKEVRQKLKVIQQAIVKQKKSGSKTG
jgi:hypothetical protein